MIHCWSVSTIVVRRLTRYQHPNDEIQERYVAAVVLNPAAILKLGYILSSDKLQQWWEVMVQCAIQNSGTFFLACEPGPIIPGVSGKSTDLAYLRRVAPSVLPCVVFLENSFLLIPIIPYSRLEIIERASKQTSWTAVCISSLTKSPWHCPSQRNRLLRE